MSKWDVQKTWVFWCYVAAVGLLMAFVSASAQAARECVTVSAFVPCTAAGAQLVDDCKDDDGNPLGEDFAAIRTVPSVLQRFEPIAAVGVRSIRVCTGNEDPGEACCLATGTNLVCQVPTELRGTFRVNVLATLDGKLPPPFQDAVCRQGLTVTR